MRKAMRASAAQAGFTLLEMMIVITIIAIFSGIIGYSLTGISERNLSNEVERMQLTLQMAADEAVFGGYPIGVTLTRNGYGFLRYEPVTRRWLPVTGKSLRPRKFQGMELKLELSAVPISLSESPSTTAKPMVLLSSEGEMTPFILTLSLPSGGHYFTLATDGLEPIAFSKQGDD